MKAPIPSLLLILSILIAPSSSAVFGQSETVYDDSTTRPPDKAQDILTGNTPEKKRYAVEKYKLLENTIDVLPGSGVSGLDFKIDAMPLPFVLDLEGLQGLDLAPVDLLDRDIQRRYHDVPATIPLTAAIESLVRSLKKSSRKRDVQDLPLPTDMEIDVLKVLWVEGSATPGEIYAQLDTSNMIFAEQLQNVMEKMVGRGFLDRKKISPSHEFTLFGFAKIELSSKNRKNKVYLYWPIITREKLFTYLDAKRYLALVAARGDNDYDIRKNDYTRNYQKYLEKKLYRMFDD